MYRREKKVIVLEGVSRKWIEALMTAFGKHLSSMGIRYIIPTCPTCISEENKASYNILGLLPGGVLYDAIFDSNAEIILMDGFIYSYLARNAYKDYKFDDPRLLNNITSTYEDQFDTLLSQLYNKAIFYHLFLNSELEVFNDPDATKEARLMENRFRYIFDANNVHTKDSNIVTHISKMEYIPRIKITYYYKRSIPISRIDEIASTIFMLIERLDSKYLSDIF